MKTYKVTITEKLKMTVDIEAACRYDAERIVEKRWNESEYILSADHFKGVTFTAVSPRQERSMIR